MTFFMAALVRKVSFASLLLFSLAGADCPDGGDQREFGSPTTCVLRMIAIRFCWRLRRLLSVERIFG